MLHVGEQISFVTQASATDQFQIMTSLAPLLRTDIKIFVLSGAEAAMQPAHSVLCAAYAEDARNALVFAYQNGAVAQSALADI